MLGRALVERFQPDVLDWLQERVELVVVDPWVDVEAWETEAPNVDAILSRKGRITRAHIEASGGRLKVISRTGVGVDPSRVDLIAAKEHRVWVTNQPGSNSVSVAELVFGQMIALVRHTHAADRAVKEGRWGDYLQFLGSELAEKTIGIIGMGNIGTRVALRARAFEMDFLVYDPYVPESHVKALGGRWVSLLDELLAESDFVTVHCPLTDETDAMISARELALMKPGAFLINAARGGIVEEQALLETMRRRAIAGAALDVVADEPPGDNPLFRLDNVIFTPHLGAVTLEASARGEWGAAEEAIRVLEGKRPKNPVFELE